MSDVDPAFGHWLAGFIDGEGSFVIRQIQRPGGTCYSCAMTIHLRDDDESLLRNIARRTGCGKIRSAPVSPSSLRRLPGSKPQAVWDVASKVDCLRMVAVLDAHQLQSKKARDYAIWREAVLFWTRMRKMPAPPETVDRGVVTGQLWLDGGSS